MACILMGPNTDRKQKKKTVDVECGTPNKAIMGDEIIMGISLVQHD
jgi:hypothetical protein